MIPVCRYHKAEASKYYGCAWTTFSKKFIAKNPLCTKCQSTHWLQVDHIIPVCFAGTIAAELNFQTLCYECHSKKTGKDKRIFNVCKKFKIVRNMAGEWQWYLESVLEIHDIYRHLSRVIREDFNNE